MATNAIMITRGLNTDANAVNAPDGSLRIADNIMINEHGTVESRPSIEHDVHTGALETTGPLAVNMLPVKLVVDFDQGIIMGSSGDTTPTPVYIKPFEDTDAGHLRTLNMIATAGDSGETTTNTVDAIKVRGNLYINSNERLYKMINGDSSTWEAVGFQTLPPLSAGTSKTSGVTGPYPNSTCAAYRYIVKRRDAAGVVHTSEPSPWTQANCGSSGFVTDSSGLVSIFVTPDFVDGDIVEFYRSMIVPDTEVPSDDMYLVGRKIVAQPYTYNLLFYTDNVANENLGEALYTNAGQQGIENANATPPACVALETWQGCLWLGGVRKPHELQLTYSPNDDEEWLDLADSVSCTFTSSTTMSVTGSDASKIKVGMWCTSYIELGLSTRIASGTYVTAVTGSGPYNVTIDTPAAVSSGTFTDVVFADWIDIGDERYFVGLDLTQASAATVAPLFLASGAPATSNGRRGLINTTLRSLASMICQHTTSGNDYSQFVATVIEDPQDVTGGAQLIIRRRQTSGDGDAAFSVTNYNNEAISFPLATGGTSVREEALNVLMFSKPDEPEHIPALNFINVCPAPEQIRRLVALRDSMLVFTTRNVYRVTGSAPKSWAVELFLPGTVLIHRECADVMDGECFALTNRGALKITDTGSENISRGFIGRTLEEYRQTDSSSGYAPGDTWTKVRCAPNLGLVMFCLGNDSGFSQYIYCYSISNGAWTRWTDVGCMALAYSAQNDWVYMLRNLDYFNTQVMRKIRTKAQSECAGVDGVYTYAEGEYAFSGTTLYLSKAANPGYIPNQYDSTMHEQIGSVITSEDTLIISELGGPVWQCELDREFTDDGTVTVRERIISTVEWQGQTFGVPFETKDVTEYQMIMDHSEDIATEFDFTFELSVRTDMAESSEVYALTKSSEPISVGFHTHVYRWILHRNYARASHYFPRLSARMPNQRWRLNGLALIGDSISNRTRMSK